MPQTVVLAADDFEGRQRGLGPVAEEAEERGHEGQDEGDAGPDLPGVGLHGVPEGRHRDQVPALDGQVDGVQDGGELGA